MASNQNQDPIPLVLSVACTTPSVPASGGPVRLGKLCGVALTDESAGGNASGYTSVDFSTQVVSVPVYDHNTGGIAPGDKLYFTDADSASAYVGNFASGDAFWGYALEVVTSGATKTIKTLKL